MVTLKCIALPGTTTLGSPTYYPYQKKIIISPVPYNRNGENDFTVLKPPKKCTLEGPMGLYYHDNKHRAVALNNTMKENQEGYS